MHWQPLSFLLSSRQSSCPANLLLPTWKPFLSVFSPFSRKGSWVRFPKPGLLGSFGMQLLLCPSRTCHQDLLGGKKVTTLCLLSTTQHFTSLPPPKREKKYSEICSAVYSAVYEKNSPTNLISANVHSLWNYSFKRKISLLRRKYSGRWNEVWCSHGMSWYPGQATAGRMLKVCACGASSLDFVLICKPYGLHGHGCCTPLLRGSSLLCATLVQKGQPIQAPQWHFCGSHCLAQKMPWKMASVFPTRWVTGPQGERHLLSLACREHLLKKVRSHGQSWRKVRHDNSWFSLLSCFQVWQWWSY